MADGVLCSVFPFNTFFTLLLYSKVYLTKRSIAFRDSAFPQLYWLKFSFKSVDVSKCYSLQENKRGCFLKHGV